MLKNNKKKIAAIIIGFAVLTSVILFGTIAFFTSNDVVTNKLIIGNVRINLTETQYPGNENSSVTDMLPYSEIEKNPQIQNVGVNEAFVFMKVTVPLRNVTEVNPDGTYGTQKMQEIFYLKSKDDSELLFENHFNENWIELPVFETGTDGTKDTRTYVFGYKKSLATGDTTESLFDKVQLKNIKEELGANQAQSINIEACAVQSDYISVEVTDKTNLNQTQLEDIYRLFNS
ncbi:MAG: hypothetical protein ACI4XP_10345 [Acutalibacteraceae bacterium]